MTCIAELEESYEEDDIGHSPCFHSFSPAEFPNETLSEKEVVKAYAEGEANVIKTLPPGRRYWICHYFDFVCGSSTGA